MDDSPPSIDEILAQSAWVRRLALRLVTDAAERDDVVQDAWLEALAHAPRADELRPWLFGVVRNVARMNLRGAVRRRRREEAAPQIDPDAAAAARPDAVVERVQLERQVADVLLALGEPYRTALLLRYYEDLSPSEIAARLGVPAGTVRWRLKHGLGLLRARLDERFGERRRWGLALVPTAAAARGSLGKAIPWALAGVIAMKVATKIVAAAALVLLLALGGMRLFRHATPSAGGVDGARAGAAWRMPGGVGAPTEAPATVEGVKIPEWFGQRGAPIRRIAGRVTFGGAPVGGAKVELGSALVTSGVLTPMTRLTGSDGRFDFGPLPPAAYVVAASERTHSPAVVDVDTRDPATASERLELRLGGCEASLFGHVSDASGGPVAGAKLCHSPPRSVACVNADDGGSYEMCVGPRQLAVEVSAKGYGAVNERVRFAGRRVKRDFLLTPEATITGRVVRADDGRPVDGAYVRSMSGEPPSQRWAADGATTSDAQGRFTLGGLAPGRHRLIAGAESLTSAELVEINVEAGHTTAGVTLRLRRTARLSGVVTDGHDPVAGAVVRLRDPQTQNDAVTQSDGSFTLDNAPRGAHAVDVVSYDVEEPKSILIDRADLSGVRIRVAALGSISGRVTRAGKPLAGAEVSFSMKEPAVLSDSDGNYKLRGLRPETYQVWAGDTTLGAFGTVKGIKLDASEQRTGVDIDVKYASSIAGTIVEANGAPAAGVYVRFQAEVIDDGGDDVTAPDGSFRATNMMGGADYTPFVQASQRSRERFAPAEGAFAPVRIPDGDTHIEGVRLVIKREHLTVAGTTVGGDGTPLSDVRVTAYRTDGDPVAADGWFDHPNAISGGDGSFRIAELDAGSYSLQARAGDGSEATVKNVAAGASGLVIKLQSAGGIDGTLVGYSTPPSVIAVRYVDGAPMVRSFATVEGNGFSLRGLPPGSYQAAALGEGDDTQAVTVTSGQVATVTLRNRGTGSVQGRVVEWRSGAPVAGVQCITGPMGSSGWPVMDFSHSAFTDSDGRFTLDGVPLGAIAVRCDSSLNDYSNGAALVTVTDGQPASCEVAIVRRLDEGEPGSIGVQLDFTRFLGARFFSVMPNGPGARAGIRAGDMLATVDGTSVDKLTPWGAIWAVVFRPRNSAVKIGLQRGGAVVETSVVVGSPDP